MMLTVALSSTGQLPATDFICTRYDTLEALGRIETYQTRLEKVGKPRVPVTLYIGKRPLDMGGDVKSQLAEHEKATLDRLGLRRAA